ncbi:hypothetical protein [Arthrobacter sp. 08Y14]|uniref:hypothetical protein n=1 Tax=Arthrobacter sp. 08Y14 TaxID=2058885 RepID=UPI0011B0C2E9|nr:hypothetical protein [Arthrobacter sp. 08Y14]
MNSKPRAGQGTIWVFTDEVSAGKLLSILISAAETPPVTRAQPATIAVMWAVAERWVRCLVFAACLSMDPSNGYC